MDDTSALQKFTYLRSTFGCAASVVSWCFVVIFNLMMTSEDDMTSWKLEFIIWPRLSFGARCPRQDISQTFISVQIRSFGFYLDSFQYPRRESSLDSLSTTLTPVQSISWPPLRTTCSPTADFELAALDLCSERRFPHVFENPKTFKFSWCHAIF